MTSDVACSRRLTNIVVGSDECDERRVDRHILIDLRRVDALRERRSVIVDVNDVDVEVHVGGESRHTLIARHNAKLKELVRLAVQQLRYRQQT